MFNSIIHLSMDTKTLKLEYLYLDNQTCNRCRETEKQLDATLDDLGLLLKTAGFNVSLEKVKMDSKQKAHEYRFTKSPTIRVNNTDIGFEQTENNCSDCGDLCGCG